MARKIKLFLRFIPAILAFTLIFCQALPRGTMAGSFTIETEFYDIYGKSTGGGPNPVLGGGFAIGASYMPGPDGSVAFTVDPVSGYDLEAVTLDDGEILKYLNVVSDGVNFTIEDNKKSYRVVLHYAQKYTDGDNVPGLKDVFKPWFNIGTVESTNYMSNAAYSSYILKHYNIFTPENDMKPQYLLPSSAPAAGALVNGFPELTFTGTDAYMTYAKNNNLRVRGHTLIWHSQGQPAWFFRENYASSGNMLSASVPAQKEEMLKRLEWYIDRVITYYEEKYPGVIYGWDVINEAVAENGMMVLRGDGRDTSNWFATLGHEYMYWAFYYARKTVNRLYPNGGGPLLYYNDFAINGEVKRQTALDYIKPFINETLDGRKLIDGIGEQAHHHINNSVAGDEETYRVFAEMFDYVDITEMDVLISTTTTPPSDRETIGLLRQATWYHDFFEALKSVKEDYGNLNNVIFWGLSDSQSWKAMDGGVAQYPLLFTLSDNTYIPKPAYWAITGIEGPSATVEERVALIYQGTPQTVDFWDAHTSYPIGRLGEFKAVYDNNNIYFYITAKAGAVVEVAVGNEIFVSKADKDGTLILTVPKPDGDSVKFDIGVKDTITGKKDAWNSYFYKGYNLGKTDYQGKLLFRTETETRAITSASTISSGASNPTLNITIANNRSGTSPFATGNSLGFTGRVAGKVRRSSERAIIDGAGIGTNTGEVWYSDMEVGDPMSWNVDTGTTGLRFIGAVTGPLSGTDANPSVGTGFTELRFSGTASPGIIRVSADASAFGQRAMEIKTSNVLEFVVGSASP